MAQLVKNSLIKWENWVQTLSWEDPLEDPLEEGMEIHPSTLLWEIPWTEEPGEL